MAVVSIAQEAPDSPKATFELGQHVITRKFKVQTDSFSDGPGTVALAIGVPRLFQPYVFGREYLPFCRVREVEPERIAPNSLWWIVTVTYRTPELKGGAQGDGGNSSGSDASSGDGGGTQTENDQQFENPLLALAEIETHFQTQQQAIYAVYDTSKNPPTFTAAKSSAGEIFNPPPMKDSSTFVMTITRNEGILSPHPALAVLYQDTVNSDSFWGCGAGQVKCQSITVQRQNKQYPDGTDFPYLRVTYTFHFKESWDLSLLDKGSYYKDDIGGFPPVVNKVRFKSDDGNPIEGLLDGKGGKLGDDANPVFLPVRPYNRLPFAALGLPQSFAQTG
jgi:hypothetical protein